MRYLKYLISAAVVLLLPAHATNEYGIGAGLLVWFSLLSIALVILIRGLRNDSY